MSGEKMAILKMLEEGKITAENAANLLAALSEPKTGGENEASLNERHSESGTNTRDGQFSRDTSKNWAGDFGKKIEAAAKDLEPKIQKLAGVVVEKSVELADNLSKSVQKSSKRASSKEAVTERQPRSSGFTHSKPSSASNISRFELSVSYDSPNEIILKSPKGNVSVKGYNGDKATINLFCQRKTSSARDIEFLRLGYVYRLEYDFDSYEAVSMEVFIPFAMFRQITVETAKSDVSIDNIDTDKITVNTSGCHISIKNVTAETMKINNYEGRMLLGALSGLELTADNDRGVIEASNTDFKHLRIEGSLEPINIITQGFYKHNDYDWVIRTANAKLSASLPVSPDVGYNIRAFTSLSDVSNGLSGIVYTRNDRSCIEGKTQNYDMKQKKVKINMDTSNAPLNINS